MPNFVAPEVKKFVTWDYIVFAALFLVSVSIGVFFAVKERKKKTSKEFLVGGRQMTCGPIAFSLTSSFMSAVTVLGTPSEVYRYGASFVLFFLSYTLVIIFTSELFLPVFYRSGITSTYESFLPGLFSGTIFSFITQFSSSPYKVHIHRTATDHLGWPLTHFSQLLQVWLLLCGQFQLRMNWMMKLGLFTRNLPVTEKLLMLTEPKPKEGSLVKQICLGIWKYFQYLELRFNKIVRLAATLIYILQTHILGHIMFTGSLSLPKQVDSVFLKKLVKLHWILYTGIVVYAPSLALNQVTGFDLWGSVAATGIVCTFYCTLGGLKAVVWTDAFQMVVMVAGFMVVLIRGTSLNGGATKVWEDAHEGSRLNIFDFDVDPLRRHTFWTIVIGGTFTWLGLYGVNQSTIQRCISCKSERHAKLALYLNLLGLWTVLVCAVFCGLVMYSHYKSCDPWTAAFISAPDQLMPYFVMDIFSSMPGVPGLFVACAFSGTLSTVAASINALATVTFEDLVKKGFPNISEKMSTWISKGLCVLYGVLCTSMAAAASLLGGVVQASLSIHGMCGGPMLGLFTLGIVFPCANWKGALGGLLAGISLVFWTGTGSFIYPAPPTKSIPLQLSTLNCTLANSTEALLTAAPMLAPERPLLADTWYSLSYLYFSAIGCVGCAITGLLISFITGPSKGEDIPPVLIKPVCDLFCFWSKRLKIFLWCGVRHDNLEPTLFVLLGLRFGSFVLDPKMDFEKKLPKAAANKTRTDNTFKNNTNKENNHQIHGYISEENSYTNISRESRL